VARRPGDDRISEAGPIISCSDFLIEERKKMSQLARFAGRVIIVTGAAAGAAAGLAHAETVS
jgi:hypothetical protein